jgi:hypothetical protein
VNDAGEDRSGEGKRGPSSSGWERMIEASRRQLAPARWEQHWIEGAATQPQALLAAFGACGLATNEN